MVTTSEEQVRRFRNRLDGIKRRRFVPRHEGQHVARELAGLLAYEKVSSRIILSMNSIRARNRFEWCP
jgi:hypothetical protein